MSNSPIIFDPKNYQTIQGTQPADLQKKKKTDTTFGEDVKDFGLSIGKGIASIPEAAIGLADAVTTAAQINSSGRAFRDTADSFGLKAREWGDNLSQMQSEGYRAKQQEFDNQNGFLDKVAYGIKNPTLITNAVGESLPSMVVGGSVGKGVGKGIAAFTGRQVSDTAAAATGEGLMMAGQQAANIQKESNGLTTGQALASLGTGAIGGGLGMLGGKVADKMGLADADTYIVGKMGGKKMAGEVSDKAAKWTNVPNSVVKGVLSEGLLEELPQSLSEQIIQNIATDKHWSDGLDSAAAMGVLAGGSMGGAFGGASGLVDYQASKKAANQLVEQQAANAESESLIAQQPESDSFAGDNNISENIASSQNLSSSQFDDSAEPRKQQAQDAQSSQSIISAADNSFSDNADNQVDLPAIESNSAREIQTQEPVANVLPSEEMGLSRSRGSLEAAAATAVDTIAPQTELSSSAPDSISVSGSSGSRGSSGRKATVLSSNTAPTISAPESSNIAPIPQSYASAADVQPVAPITIADADRSNRNSKIRTKDVQQTRELLSKENRQIFDSLPSYLQRDIEIFSEYSADVQRRKEGGLPDARSHYPAYVGLAAQRVSEVMNRDKSGQLQKLIGSANRVAYGHRSTYGWSQPLPMGAEAAADAFQPVAAKKAAKAKQAANTSNPLIGSAANQRQEAVQQQAQQEQVQTATQSAPEAATLGSQLQSAPATDSIQQAQKQNPLDNFNDFVKADYNTVQNQINKHRKEGNAQALKQSEMQLRRMRSKVSGFESAAQSFVAGDIDRDTFLLQSEGFQKAATKIIQAQQEQNAEAVMEESRAEQQEQSVQASEQAKQEAPAQIDPIEPSANRKDGKDNLSAKGWWNNQPDNVSVYLVGKSRGKDTLKVTENDDGSFDAQIAIAGVGGEISKASRKQLNDWVKARLNKPNGEQLSLKKVKAATKAANQDSKKFSKNNSAKASTSNTNSRTEQIKQAIENSVGKEQMQHIDVVQYADVARPDNAEDLLYAQGWFDPKSKRITLIADNFKDEREAIFTAWHELGHRNIDGKRFTPWRNLFISAHNGNRLVRELTAKIQQQRKGLDDVAATNKLVAVEEAVVELYSAWKNNDYVYLDKKYGLKVSKEMLGKQKGFFERLLDAAKRIIGKKTGVDSFTSEDIIKLLQRVDGGRSFVNVESSSDVKKFSFAGERAKNAHTENLDKAKQMEINGESQIDILEQTGWQRGTDSKWRFEIDDSKIELNHGFNDDPKAYFVDNYHEAAVRERGVPLGNILIHPELFAAYPKLKGYRLKIDKGMKHRGAFFPAEDTGVAVGTIVLQDPYYYEGIYEEFKDVLVHEVQHAVQQLEDFATGGNIVEFSDRSGYQDELRRLKASQARFQEGSRGWEVIQKSIDNLTEENTWLTAEDQYRRLAGEVEARNVTERRKMTAEQRKESPASFTEDVETDKQIVRFEQSVQESIYSDDADKIKRALDKMGIQYSSDSSRQSNSEYIDIYDEESDKSFKIRISDHALPSSYFQPDFNVSANGAKTNSRGVDATRHADGTWASAVAKAAEVFGKEVPKYVQNIITKEKEKREPATVKPKGPEFKYDENDTKAIRKLKYDIYNFQKLLSGTKGKSASDIINRNKLNELIAKREKKLKELTKHANKSSQSDGNENNDGIKFSRAAQPANKSDRINKRLSEVIRATTNTDRNAFKNIADNKRIDMMAIGLQALGRRQITDIYSGMIPELENYDTLSDRFAADGNMAAVKADKLVTQWGKVKDDTALANLMHDATLAGIDADAKAQDAPLKKLNAIQGKLEQADNKLADLKQELVSAVGKVKDLLHIYKTVDKGLKKVSDDFSKQEALVESIESEIEKLKGGKDSAKLKAANDKLDKAKVKLESLGNQSVSARKLIKKVEADLMAAQYRKDTELPKLIKAANKEVKDLEKAENDFKEKMKAAEGLFRRFKALSPEAQAVYRQARDDYLEHYDAVKKAMQERMERAGMSAKAMDEVQEKFAEALSGVYFPLARFGKYVVYVKDAEGKTLSVSRAETKNEAEAMRANLAKKFPARDGNVVSNVMLDKEYSQQRDSVGKGFMNELFTALESKGLSKEQYEDISDTLNQLYLNSMPDLSWAKHGIHRKGTPGFSDDARRAYAQNMFHGASYLSKLRYGDLMQQSLEDMQEYVNEQASNDSKYKQPEAQRVVDEMVARHDAVMNPQSSSLSTALTSFGFLYYLGLSPASAIVNMSQTALVAYPVMAAKWGGAKSAKALLEASAQTASKKGGYNNIRESLNNDEKAAFDQAVSDGIIDVSQAHDLAGIAQGEDAGVLWKTRRVMRAASWMFHQAELFNRQITFIAAYRLAKAEHGDSVKAFAEAKKATYDGHFDYSSQNRPRFMQGDVAKVVFLFKQYAQNMVYTLARNAYKSFKGDREAQKTLAGILVAHSMAAGVLGLPMVGTLLAAASWLGGDDDEPWDAEAALRNQLAEIFGKKGSEVISKGLSRLTPMDISGRVSLNNLIFPDIQEGLQGARAAESFAAAMMGPVLAIGTSAVKGMSEIGEGNYARGLETMLPVSVRNPLKAYRYYTSGHTDKSGIVIKDDFDTSEIAGQALGFSPSDLRLKMEGKGSVYRADRAVSLRRTELMNMIAKAIMEGDREAATEVRQEINRFNQKNPTRKITYQQVASSVKNRRKRIKDAENGVYLAKSREKAREAGSFAFEEADD